MNNCNSPLPENIINIIYCLNQIEGFKSPKPDFGTSISNKNKGLHNLEKGTRTLIKLADTAHDFNFFEFNFSNTGPVLEKNGLLATNTMEVLKFWIQVCIEELSGILPTDVNSCIDIDELKSCICTSPENFVYYYLYWHDNFNVVNSCDIGGGANIMEYDPTIIKTIIFSNLDCSGSSHMPLFRNKLLSNSNERYRDYDYANNNKNIIKRIANNLRQHKTKYELDGNYFSVDQGASYDIIKHNDNDIYHFVIHSFAKIYDQPIGGGPSDSDTILRHILFNKDKPMPNNFNLDVTTEEYESTILIKRMKLSEERIYIEYYNNKNYCIPYDFKNRAKIKNAGQCFMAYVSTGEECGPLVDAAGFSYNIQNLINIINSVCSIFLERESIINKNGTFNLIGEETIITLTIKIISILTDLKRNGDYLQVKEIKYVDLYNINNIIHITHDRISGYISHKIFGNYTMFVKNIKKGTCQLYLLMIPQNIENHHILNLQSNINNDINTSCTKTTIIRTPHDIINHNINRDAFYNFLNTGCIYDNDGINQHYPNVRNNIWTFGGSDKTTTKTTSNSPSYNNIRLIDSLNIIMNKENEFIILINNNIYNNANSYNNTLKLKNNVLSKSNNENLLKIMYLFKVFNNKDLFNYDINNIEILSHNNTELKNKTKTELRHDENKTIKNLDMCCDMLLHTLTSIQKLIIIDIKNIIIIINKFIRKNIRLINKKQENPILNNHLLAILQIAVLFVVKKEEDNENINNELINKEDNTKLKRENIFELIKKYCININKDLIKSIKELTYIKNSIYNKDLTQQNVTTILSTLHNAVNIRTLFKNIYDNINTNDTENILKNYSLTEMFFHSLVDNKDILNYNRNLIINGIRQIKSELDIDILSTKKQTTKLSTKKQTTKLSTKKQTTKLSTKKQTANLATKKQTTNLSTKKQTANLATTKLATKKQTTKLATTSKIY